ncbi:GNAT family N-acetyltransferase [Jeotgalibacillus haloalkalitolerans]|uniref:GNAT family N-acetyltransferase n=1 Tax=Jeotgalibacillus haloalkalitolerans TaxID=3104292 RepID=A0ABU5KN63_9BACL|nr:GNAT family N-acetyltransferase [Jeotgalibacillus sp. HH7-29]MDZ5712703.1 GNAT family N-acetyltransferase [Jeotgalibacillus sp. HH7-29]
MIYLKEGNLTIRSMKESDIEDFPLAFEQQGWYKPQELYKDYYMQQSKKEIEVIVAENDDRVAGYAVLKPGAHYGPFQTTNTPEIADLNVLIKFQKNGIGHKIMDTSEKLAKEKSESVSLAVGLHSGYGSAQRIYIKRGYIPDGSGVWYKGKPLAQYADCNNSDELTLYLLKKL